MWKSSSRIVSQSKHSIQHGKLISRRNVAGNPSPKRYTHNCFFFYDSLSYSSDLFSKNSKTSAVTIGGAVVLTLTGGSIIAAKTSDGYRNLSEKYIPGTTFLHNLLLGPMKTNIDVPLKYTAFNVSLTIACLISYCC